MASAALENYGNAAQPATSPSSDEAESAIELVVTASRAIREKEARVTQAITRVQVAAKAAQQKYDESNERAERAEAALKAAEAQIGELLEKLQRAHGDAKALQGLVEDKIERLKVVDQRAAVAEKRANELSASLEGIGASIRTNLPVVSVAPEPA